MPNVNSQMLSWARESAGLSLEDAADRLNIGSARGSNPVERLEAIETGVTQPSRAQLLAMVATYRRPLLTFYMAEPPRPGIRGEDYRTLPGSGAPRENAQLAALLRDVHSRQSLVHEVLEEDEDAKPLLFVDSMSRRSGVAEVLASMQAALRLSKSQIRKQATADKVFAFLRGRAEALGVFVLLLGDLGSHHTAIDIGTFRGFALADPIAPFIVINDKDTRTAWSFTLIHELAHIWIGATGISGGGLSGSPTEQFCNDVASYFLLPEEDLQQLAPDLTSDEDPINAIIRFADYRKLSPDLVAYRAFRAGMLSRELWNFVRSGLQSRLQTLRDQEAKRDIAKSSGSFYTTRRHRLGALVEFTRRSLEAGSLTPTKAALVLGVKPRMVAQLLAAA